jgi:hypothetical protein
MIISKDFVLINFPKSGSTFVRKVLKDIYDKRINDSLFLKYSIKLKLREPLYQELLMPNIKFKTGLMNNVDQHGIYSQIPKEHLNKEIFTVVRNPYERIISSFEFKFWQQRPALEEKVLKNHFPNFPNLSIDDFIDYLILVSRYSFTNEVNKLTVGFMSLQFIMFFFKEPKIIINQLNDNYLKSNSLYKNDMAQINFLRQENLNMELAYYLKKFDFTDKELEYITNHKQVNITKDKVDNRESLITEKVKNYVNEYEYLYLKILKDNNIDYFKIY